MTAYGTPIVDATEETLLALKAVLDSVITGAAVKVDVQDASLTIGGEVALTAGSLAALENVVAELGPTSLAALENITVGVSGDVSLSAATLAALEAITAVIASGSVGISSIAAGDNNIGNVDVVTVPADPFGATADAAVVTDTTGSLSGKLRGLVKWAFERMPASLGQKAMAASLPVVFASDQTPLPISQPGLAGGIAGEVMTVGTTAVAIPAAPLAGRSSFLVQARRTNTASVWLGPSDVTADDTAGTGGIELQPGESFPIALAAAVLLYARSTTAGQKVALLEIAA